MHSRIAWGRWYKGRVASRALSAAASVHPVERPDDPDRAIEHRPISGCDSGQQHPCPQIQRFALHDLLQNARGSSISMPELRHAAAQQVDVLIGVERPRRAQDRVQVCRLAGTERACRGDDRTRAGQLMGLARCERKPRGEDQGQCDRGQAS